IIRLLVSSARSWNASGLLMTLNAFIGRLRNNVCLCSKIKVSITKTKALLTGVTMSQTCIGTRETDDLRSQVLRRTKPTPRTARSATPGPCAGWIRGPGGRLSDEHPAVHLGRRRGPTEPLDGPGPLRAPRVRGLREPVARERGPFESRGLRPPRIGRVRQRRSPASTPNAGDCLLLLNRRVHRQP